jgi:hypothetical protein
MVRIVPSESVEPDDEQAPDVAVASCCFPTE